MSLILEALKKSERQRRLGEAPSLGSPVIVVRRRRSLLPLLVGLIVVALAVGWWLRRDDSTAADVQAVAEAPPTATQATAPTAPAAAVEPGFDMSERVAARADQRPRERTTSQAASRPPVSKVPPDANTGMPADVRKRVDSGELVVANPNLLKPGQPSTIDSPETAAPPSADRPARSARREAAEVPEAPEEKYYAPGTKPAPAESATPAVTAPPAATGSPIPLLWELPYAQRRDIPELKVSMHVYASEPANRFVIINGERRTEGEDFDGVRLVEIRNDGIILERQGVRFLYPRGGR
ncbi:MAG: general secretion pathway protein GspB [Luteimonas sp.]|uniref:general secretion pathway protein GspB n=1 Tax=Dokdonella sp. TaxID=2291710 RepID=UPI0025B94C9F|nr:general secretion pathway protein GspB [Dokdonella sp.]MBX3691285.1 general secretion pathway protein GspB [Dokdonella sp.]MCW5580496.1 general secretion pathway protein GspB [Luteimonas sp.]